MITGKRVLATLTGATVLMAMFVGSASAGLILVKDKFEGHDAGRPGTFQAEVKTNAKGRPVKLNFIQFNGFDYDCTHPSMGPVVVDAFEVALPFTKVKRQGNRYTFSTSEGPDHMSGRISKNGRVVTGKAHFQFLQVHDENPVPPEGYFCESEVEFKAESFFES